MRTTLLPLLALAMLAAAAPGCQQDRGGDAPRVATPDVDRTFVTDAASGGLKEVRLGEMARQKASSAEVKKLAHHMAEDHRKANAELAVAAKADGVDVRGGMLPADEKTVRRLQGLSGAEFDRAYLRAAVEGHEKSVAGFEQEAAQGKRRNVKEFAVRTLPTLREHLQQAKTLQQKVK